MALCGKLLCLICCILVIFSFASCERTKDKMYQEIGGAVACFRRLNGTHQFGCAAHRSGNVGVIHIVNNQTDLRWLVDHGEATPYAAVICPDMFTRNVMMQLKHSGKVNGVILLGTCAQEDPIHFTHEDTCPNRYSGLEKEQCTDENSWNPEGTKMMLDDWGFPIFHVGDESNATFIKDCFEKYNSHERDKQMTRSLCAVELQATMYAAVDTVTCIRRSNIITNFNPVKVCDPLGDRNVWMTLDPRNKSDGIEADRSIIVVATRLDTTTMFDDLVPGANSPVTGLVTLMAAANLLSKMSKMKPEKNEQLDLKNVMFLIINGESYDYIGSSRIVYDMEKGQFPAKNDSQVPQQVPPMNLSNVGLFIELNQVSFLNEQQLVFHTPKQSFNEVLSHNKLWDFMEEMRTRSQEMGIKFTDVSQSLPPSSLHSFLKSDKNIPGVVITDHKKAYVNKYYHSIYDNGKQLNYSYFNGTDDKVDDSIQLFIANLSTALARTLYKLITNENPENLTANATLVDELMYCYIVTPNCSLFRAASYKQKLQSKPLSLYVGVTVSPNLVTSLTGQVLALLTGNLKKNITEEDCHSDANQQILQYIWVKGCEPGEDKDEQWLKDCQHEENATGICVETTMNYSAAISPAFVIDGYNLKSGNYSSWAESIWSAISVRIFLKPSRSHEIMTFSVGLVVLILSFVVVYFTNSRTDLLFSNTSNQISLPDRSSDGQLQYVALQCAQITSEVSRDGGLGTGC